MPQPTDMTAEQRIALTSMTAISDVTETSGATVLAVPEAPHTPMLNRVVGLGLGSPATQQDVAEAVGAIPAGVWFYVAQAPTARPLHLGAFLHAHGLEPGWGWMAFQRGVEDPPAAQTSLRIVEVETADEAAAFARVVRESYGLPEAVEPRLAGAAGAGWLCVMALDGDEPAGAAALYVDGRHGYLGLAGTRVEHRTKGAQSALLAHRIRRAGELGCETLVTETGQRKTGSASNSYRNILRAGFTEVGVTANWLGRK